MNANELNPNLYKLMDKFLPDQIKRTNKDFFNINSGEYDIIFLNPPFGENNNFLWFKFLLHGLHLLNNSKKENKWLLLVSPPLLTINQTVDLWSIIKGVSKEGKVPKSSFLNYINELNKTKFTMKDLNKAVDGDGDLYEFVEDKYFISGGDQFGECSGFGGTTIKSSLTYFQIF